MLQCPVVETNNFRSASSFFCFFRLFEVPCLEASVVFTEKKQRSKPVVQAAAAPVNKTVNPFDRKINRVKQTVLGKKVKGTSGNIGQSRSNAIERRKNTLLVEMQQSQKSNKFMDGRFAENDDTMTEEDKMLARFQKEKIKNKNIYNLNDEEDELTHNGMALGEMEDDGDQEEQEMQDDYEADSDDDLREDEMYHARRPIDGLSDSNEPEKKTKDEVMREIMEKSKAGRAERARDKLAKEDMTRQLDEDFDEIRGELMAAGKKEDPLLKLFANSDMVGHVKMTANTEADKKSAAVTERAYDDYDSILMDLKSDEKARATDRAKTPEELMKEEKARLDKLEEDRLKRMRGEVVEEEVTDKDKARLSKRMEKLHKDKVNKPARETADDLNDDDFAKDNDDTPWYNPDAPLQSEEQEMSEEEEDGEEDGEDEDEDDEDDEDEDLDLEEDEEANDDDDDEEDEEDAEERQLERELKRMNEQKKAKEEIPFTFDVPSDIDTLNGWLEGRTDEEKALIFYRIRICNHISVKPQNKEKMKLYLPVLWRRFILIAQGRQGLLDWVELDLLSRQIFDVSQDCPDVAGTTALAVINSCHKRVSTRIENQSKLSSWPTVAELLSFKLMANVFPTSDFTHVVLTPATAAMSQFLGQCAIKTGHDILSSLFLSNIFFFTTKATDKQNGQWASFESNIYVPTVIVPEKFFAIKSKKNLAKLVPSLLEFSSLLRSKDEATIKYYETDQFKVDLLYLLLNFIESFVGLYSTSEHKDSMPTIFSLFSKLIGQLEAEKYNQKLKEKINQVAKLLKETTDQIVGERVPLVLLAHRPLPQKVFNPRFSTVYHEHGDDPDEVRQEAKKLKALHKKEMKGAIRELTKDNYFIQQEKTKIKQAERIESQAATKKIMSELQTEQAEAKQYKKLKDRLDGRI
eukprot:gene5880-6802_t